MQTAYQKYQLNFGIATLANKSAVATEPLILLPLQTTQTIMSKVCHPISQGGIDLKSEPALQQVYDVGRTRGLRLPTRRPRVPLLLSPLRPGPVQKNKQNKTKKQKEYTA
jgi:hypothetical protein